MLPPLFSADGRRLEAVVALPSPAVTSNGNGRAATESELGVTFEGDGEGAAPSAGTAKEAAAGAWPPGEPRFMRLCVMDWNQAFGDKKSFLEVHGYPALLAGFGRIWVLHAVVLGALVIAALVSDDREDWQNFREQAIAWSTLGLVGPIAALPGEVAVYMCQAAKEGRFP